MYYRDKCFAAESRLQIKRDCLASFNIIRTHWVIDSGLRLVIFHEMSPRTHYYHCIKFTVLFKLKTKHLFRGKTLKL